MPAAQPSPASSPIRLSDEQMSALLAASHPLPPASRSAFLEHCARELSRLPEIGDGAVHRTIMAVQRIYYDAPDLSRARDVSKWR
jgi:hypothetical protein